MADEIGDFLAHYGVKGMKWGVRKDPVFGSAFLGDKSTYGSFVPGLRARREMKKIVLNAGVGLGPEYTSDIIRIHTAAVKSNDGIPPLYGSKAVYDKYRLDAARAFTKALNKKLPEGLSSTVFVHPNDSQTDFYPSYVAVGNKPGLEMHTKSLENEGFKHSDDSDVVIFKLTWTLDENGVPSSANLSEVDMNELIHSEVENFLAHYGVKGMKWGVRRDNTSGGGTYLRPFRSPQVTSGDRGTGLATRAGDHTKSMVKGTLLNVLGEIPSAYIAPLAARYGNVAPIIQRESALLNSRYSQPGKNLATNSKLKSSYDKEYQKMVVDSFKNTNIKGLVIPAFGNRIALRRLGDLDDLTFDFTLIQGKNKDRGILTVTRPSGKKEDFRLGTFHDKPTIVKSVKHADAESFEIQAAITRDADGYIIDMSIPVLEASVTHEDVSDFLAHHGIKGMKWGVRRTDAQLGNDDGGRNGVKSKSGVDVVPSKLSRKEKKEILREAAENKTRDANAPKKFGDNNSDREIDNPADVKISEDAIRFVQTRLKDGHEMSTREIQEALKRADQVQKYNELFNSPDQFNRDLHNKFDALNTTKKIAELEAELKGPSSAQKIGNFIKSAASGYQAYKDFVEKTGLPDPVGDAVRTAFGSKGGIDAAKKEIDRVTKQVKDEKERRDKADDQPDTPKLSRKEKRAEKKAQKKPSTANTVLRPPNAPTVKVPASRATAPRPAPPTVIVPPRSDRPYGGGFPTAPGTLKVPKGDNGTVVRPTSPYSPTGTVIRHEDLGEFFSKFGIKAEALDD